jgi:hypothetical protein
MRAHLLGAVSLSTWKHPDSLYIESGSLGDIGKN